MDSVIEALKADVQKLLDRAAITDCLMRYCRGIDRMDRDTVESAFWPEATDDHGVFKGTAREFVDFAFERVKNQRTTHAMGNILIEFKDSTHASCESYVQACHNAPGQYGNVEFFAACRYVDKFEKRSGEWRIIERVVVTDHIRQMTATLSVDIGVYSTVEHRSARHPNDPVYTLNLRSEVVR